jgi:ABC-2 type transport system permease protein
VLVRAVWEICKAGFHQHARYRAAILASLFTNSIFGLIRASLLLTALGATGAAIGGYDRASAATYVWLGQGMFGTVSMWGFAGLTDRIKSGDIATDFLRPVHPLVLWTAEDVGRAASQFLPRFVPMMAIGALVTGIALSTSPVDWLLFAVSAIVAVMLAFLAQVVVNLIALWVMESRGFLTLYMVVVNLLSGFVVPVSWFPGWLRTLAHATPFPSMFQSPINIAMGLTVDGVTPVAALGVQALWLLGAAVVASLMLHLGTRRVVIQGG